MPIDGLPGGDFAGCVRKMTGSVDNPEAFCAWKIHELTGKWPAEESMSELGRAVERVQLTDIEPGKGPYPGAIWNVTLIGPDRQREDSLVTIQGKEYIFSQNGIPYAVEALRDSVPMFEGCKVYDNHLTDEEFESRGGMRSFGSELTGAIVGVKFDESARKLRGQYRVGDRQYAQKLADFYELDILAESAGLSIDTFPVFVDLRHEGKRLRAAVGFERVNSTDVVTEPAAGGSLDRRIAAKQNQEVKMEITKEIVMGWFAEALAAREQDVPVEGEEITPEEVADAVIEEVAAIIEEAPADADPAEVAGAIVDVAEEIAVEVEEIVAEEEEEAPAAESAVEARLRQVETELRLAKSDRVLTAALDAAKLGAMRPAVEAAFEGRLYAKADLMNVIKRAKEAQAAQDTSGQVRGAGGSRTLNIIAGMTEAEQAEMALMEMLSGFSSRWDLRAIEASENVTVRERFTPAFKSWIAMGRPRYNPPGKRSISNLLYHMSGGDPWRARRTEANDVSSITKNAINLFIAATYAGKDEWWTDIVTEIEVDHIDDVTLINQYGLANLDIVPQSTEYQDLEIADTEETASSVKYGNTVSVALEDMLKDKVGGLARIPGLLADSWYNTQSALVAAVFTVNTNTGPVLVDTGALFNATATTTVSGHANLLTAALAFASYGAARTAMMKQTSRQLGVGRRLTTNQPRYVLGPVDLETTGLQIRNSEFEPGGPDNDVNPYYQQFDFIPVPEWTDTNNWACVADKNEYPAIYMVYTRGYRVPEIYEAGDQSSGTMFTADVLKWKVRLFTYRFSSTYTCAPVADFRGLHKSNV